MAENWSEFPIKLARGRPRKHGAYNIIYHGRLPRNRRRVMRYLQEVRSGLIQDLGPTAADLTTAQKILIDRVIQKLAILRCIEEWADENGIFEAGGLKPAFRDYYLNFSNAIRLDLQALGIKHRQKEIIDLGQYIELKEKNRGEGLREKDHKERKHEE